MDSQTKNLIGTVLILLGIASIGVVIWDYKEYLDRATGWGSSYPDWHLSGGDLFKVIAGIIGIGAGISLKKQSKI